ncbi:hypothetical protein LJR225_001255 [Phenylobacterium sp. LjRoot225]|uniref:hypothetical protein n=1 Tax=Phenylobacterium sp. LjRoot225 TaxID=3342285 RepID=UPI003ED07EB4
MVGRGTWRRLGRIFFALALVVLTLGPSLDRIVCHDEGGGLSAVAAESTVVAMPDAERSGASHDDGVGTCLHGHCHHASPYVPVEAVAADAPLPPSVLHERLTDVLPTSDPRFGLKRPPRA